MERQELRLECLKLAVGRSPDHADALNRAEAFYEFVEKQDSPKQEEKPMSHKTKPGNTRAGSLKDLE